MRKVIVGAMVSMDGVMQAPGGPEEDPAGGFKFGGWVAAFADIDPVFGEGIGKLFREPFDLQRIRFAFGTMATPRRRRDFMPGPFLIHPLARCTSHRGTSRPERKGMC